MASGHRHWRARLTRLAALPSLSRAERRQLRKQLGRLWKLEWRVFGCIRHRNGERWAHQDPLNTLIATRAKELGHVGERLAKGHA